MVDIDLKKVIIQFERKPAKQGKYYIFSIPSVYIKNGLINPAKNYRIYVEELPEDPSREDATPENS